MSDAAADYQIAYDQAVAKHGDQSPQALAAEREALNFFKEQSCKFVKQNAAKQNSVLASQRQVAQARPTAHC
jgi:hypothetical protein